MRLVPVRGPAASGPPAAAAAKAVAAAAAPVRSRTPLQRCRFASASGRTQRRRSSPEVAALTTKDRLRIHLRVRNVVVKQTRGFDSALAALESAPAATLAVETTEKKERPPSSVFFHALVSIGKNGTSRKP